MPKGVYIRKPFTERHKRKMSERKKGKPSGMLGKKHSEETKKRYKNMSYNQELYNKKSRLESYLAQLIDLKGDFLKEIVIKKGEDTDLLFEIVQDAIERIDLELNKETTEIPKE